MAKHHGHSKHHRAANKKKRAHQDEDHEERDDDFEDDEDEVTIEEEVDADEVDAQDEVDDEIDALEDGEEYTVEEEKVLMKEGLEAIYGRGRKKVNFSQLDKVNHGLTGALKTIVFTLAAVAIAAWGGFFVYNKYLLNVTDEMLIIEIEADSEIVSGEETSVVIDYRNVATIPLASLAFEVHLPDGFEVVSFDPEPTDAENLTWTIGTMTAGSDGAIQIEGVWYADTPSSTSIQALANYRPSNFNSDFQEIETVSVSTLSSVLSMEIEGPEDIVPGEDGEYTLAVRTDSEESVRDIEVEVALPEGFYIDSSDPAPLEEGAAHWGIERVSADHPIEISFVGSFASDISGFQYFDADVGVVRGDEVYTQASGQGFTDVLTSNLSIQLVVNGSTNDTTLEVGDRIRVSVAVMNTGESAIENPSLLVDFQSDEPMPINWGDASLDGGVITSDGIVLTNEETEAIEVGEKRTWNLTFPTRSEVQDGEVDRFPVVAVVENGDVQARSQTVEISFNTEADLSAGARYYNDDGAPLGSGPLPPTVGEVTTYHVYWSVKNSLHDLEDVRVSAVLPGDVDWDEGAVADIGDVAFDEGSRTVTWTISALSEELTSVGASFAVSLTPDESDIDTFVKLISGSSLQGTDVVTEALVQDTTEALTTELPDDGYVEDRGIVVE